MRGNQFLVVVVLVLCSFGGRPARADDSPSPWVGRVAETGGSLSLRPSGGEWSDSAVNDPVAAGMSLRTEAQGQAILRVGPETIALASGTELDVAQLDSAGIQLVLRRGRVGIGSQPLDTAVNIEIDTPRGGVWLLTPGDYDIAAGDERAPTRVAVLQGRARFVGKGLDTAIATGSANLLTGGDPVTAALDAASADQFAAFWRRADRAGEPPALRRVSAEMTGSDALDGNGSWETVDGYGPVWFPKVAGDEWAPYRYGHWRWLQPWGWTWIDDKPWGFAPSHYGRWARFAQADPLDPTEGGGDRWGWVPGKPAAHPVYAPALVGFLGTAGVGLSYPDAFGPAVAWFPLAPGEVYWPAYTADLDTIRRLNEAAVADVSTIGATADGAPPASVVNADYRNRRFASVVPRAVFAGGKPVAAALLHLPERRLDNAPLLVGSLQIPPAASRSAPAVSLAGIAASTPRLASAMHTLGRIMGRHGHYALARAAEVRGGHPALATAARWPTARAYRPRVFAAAAGHTRARLRLAVAHRLTR